MLTARVPVKAVGWLSRQHPYPHGPTLENVYRRLCELLKDPWEPYASGGFHKCELCQFDAETRGANNLFVLAPDAIYCCPELIEHYINAHEYCPLDEFCKAVNSCPDTRSMEYAKLLIRLGVYVPKPDRSP